MGCIIAGVGGGLGNRLPPLCSAMRLAEFYSRELYVHWSEQPELLIRLEDMFGHNLPFSTVAPRSFKYKRFPCRDDRGELTEPARVHQVDDDTDIVIGDHVFVANHIEHRSYEYEVRDPFVFEVGRHFGRLPLAAGTSARLAELDSRINYATTLGVHIRRTAQNSIYTAIDLGRDWWTLEAYARAIEIALEAEPRFKSIYVASNRPEATDYILARFPGMALYNERAGDGWSTLEFQKEAFVEMLVLSRCAAIMRQPGTTFSMFASVLNRTPTATITNVDHTNMEPTLAWDVPDAA